MVSTWIGPKSHERWPLFFFCPANLASGRKFGAQKVSLNIRSLCVADLISSDEPASTFFVVVVFCRAAGTERESGRPVVPDCNYAGKNIKMYPSPGDDCFFFCPVPTKLITRLRCSDEPRIELVGFG